ncbi:hypothetical protein [Methanolobus sp.]|uniref:hypothetical protein n=1 Tax=Methanolobus sp. TaxID=1874737 RepID=UPI0025EC4E4E|nr:hypothetical protein [Methanolobus sp.]
MCGSKGTGEEAGVKAECFSIEETQPDAYINDLIFYGHDSSDVLEITCAKPGCNNRFHMTESQWNKFNDVYYRKYGRFMLPYCSKQCQEEHLRLLLPGKKIVLVFVDIGKDRKCNTSVVFDDPLHHAVVTQ